MPSRLAASIFALLIACGGLAACTHEDGGGGGGDGSVKPGPPTDAATPPSHDGGASDLAISPAHDGGDSDGGGSCGACNTPPSGGCYGLQGTCQNGACVYPIVSGAQCDDGNPCTVADTCSAAGQCTGTPMVCDTPPSQVCVGTGTLRTYDSSGACQAGLCVYQSHDTSCGSSTCTNNTCMADPCANITCNMPPSVCYASTGTCASGSCSYAYADGATCDDGNACTTSDQCDTGVCQGVPMACDTPPASVCADASTLQIYGAQGSCSAGACSYSYSFETCATGCANGACNASGWKTMTSNTQSYLNAVWGASASAVWAGGYETTMVFYDGVEWEVRPTGITDGSFVAAIHGSSASDVFALTQGVNADDLLHFDGTSWSQVAVTLAFYTNRPAIFAVGTNDVLIEGQTGTDTSVVPYAGEYSLTRVTNGVATVLATWETYITDGSFSPTTMWAFSPTDVYLPGDPVFHWNGTAATALTTADVSAYHIWAASQGAIFSDATGAAELVNGAWQALNPNPQNDAAIHDLVGSSAQRVFAVGGNDDYEGYGFVTLYDGTGWTNQSLPAGTDTLTAAWAAPTGQVFAVGDNGTIVEGP